MKVDSSGGALTSERYGSTNGESDPAEPAEAEGVESDTPSTEETSEPTVVSDPPAGPFVEKPDPDTTQGGSRRTQKQTDKVLRKLVAEPDSERSEPNPEHPAIPPRTRAPLSPGPCLLTSHRPSR
jgi:hypothetical protein